MPYRVVKCLLPEILLAKGLDPIDVYTRPTIKMSKQQFSDYYTGRSNMSAPTLKMFSTELKIPMEKFYEWEYYPPPSKD
jgi:hypothetical protein